MASGSQNMTTYLAKGISSVLTTNASNSDNLLYINTNDTSITADMLGDTTSIAFTRANITGAYTTGHIVWLNAANIGTPFQLVVHDSSDLYLYKRWKSSGAWTEWIKMRAGTADTWTTARTLTIGLTGKSVDGSADVSWNLNEIMGASDNTKFWRGDKVWSNTLYNTLYIHRDTTDWKTGAQLQFSVTKDNTSGYSYIAAYQTPTATTYNQSLVIAATGSCFIGGGEGAETIHQLRADASGTEDLFLCPDGSIRIYTGADSKTQRAVIDSTPSFYPATTNTGNLGTSSYRWASLYSGTGNFTGDVTVAAGKRVGASGGALYLGNSGNQNWVYVQDMCSQDGQKWKIHQSGAAEFNGTVTAPTFSGNATTATALYTGGPSNTSASDQNARIREAIKAYFNANKASIPRNKTISLYVSTGNGEQATGYFLSGYDSAPYGGFFVCHYDTPRYVGISNGSYSCHELVRNDSRTYSINVSGSSGSCTGNAATASKVGESTSWLYFHHSNEVNFGGTNTSTTIYFGYRAADSRGKPTDFVFGSGSGTANVKAAKVYNAVWNDYAEYRRGEIIEGGYCVVETSNGVLQKTIERLQPACHLTSDTWGTIMGETKDAKTPIAVAGRVLAYPYRSREQYHLGDALCSAPGGTVDIMTREEIREYPERIVGIVSEIPDYEIWHAGAQDGNHEIQVNGRIWIYVR